MRIRGKDKRPEKMPGFVRIVVCVCVVVGGGVGDGFVCVRFDND